LPIGGQTTPQTSIKPFVINTLQSASIGTPIAVVLTKPDRTKEFDSPNKATGNH